MLIQALTYLSAAAPLIAPSYSPLLSPALAIGEKIVGSLSTSSGQNFRDGGYVAAYTLHLEKETVVRISVASNDFTPIMSVFSPNGDLVDISSRHYPVFDFNADLLVEVPTTGQYIVVVSSESNWEYGEFAIQVEQFDDDAFGGVSIAVDFPFELDAYLEITPQNEWRDYVADIYTFEVAEATWVSFNVSSDDFDTVLELTDHGGSLIAANDDTSPDNYNSQIFTFLKEGSYRLLVRGWWSDSEGAYQLSSERFSAID